MTRTPSLPAEPVVPAPPLAPIASAGGSTTRTTAYWICQLTGWVGFATWLSSYAVTQFPARSLAGHFGILALAGIALSHTLRRFIRRGSWASLPVRRLAPRAVAASAALGLILLVALVLSATCLFHMWPLAKTSPVVCSFLWVSYAGLFLVWQLIYFTVHALERVRASEVEKWQLVAGARDAELRALKAQLNPHFLFNSLNNLRALIPESPERAQRMVTQLAGILRYSLGAAEHSTVPLARELEVVADYLALEEIRLEERLRVVLHVAPETLAVQVPTMLVQTLVENGIKHGVARLAAGGVLTIRAELEEGTLRVTITNPVPPSTLGDSSLAPPGGIGVVNARERLRLVFGARAQLSVDTMTPGLATASLALPARLPAAASGEPPVASSTLLARST